MLSSGAASASEAAPAAPAASRAAPGGGGVLGQHARGAGEDEDAVEHAEDETDPGADDSRDIPRPSDGPIGMGVHLSD